MSKLFEDIKDSSNLITGHINPDGDALGSALAFNAKSSKSPSLSEFQQSKTYILS